jgi:DNA-binding CsgD family transcriptional regulator
MEQHIQPQQHDRSSSACAQTGVSAGAPRLTFFLGLAATRVWLQCNLFASYTQSDDGLVSIISNFSYGAVMVLTALLVLCFRSPTRRFETAVGWASLVFMTAATLFLIISKDSGQMSVLVIGCVLAGIGGAFGGGMWTVAYVRLGLRQSLYYSFASLALGSLGGFVLGFLPNLTSYVVSLFMPAIALLCYQQAMKVDVDIVSRPQPCYDTEPRLTVAFVLGGVAVFGLVLGFSRGFPAGDPVVMGPALRAVHQLGVVALSLFVIWWTTVRNRRLSFAFLWRIEILIVGIGTFLLSAFPGYLTGVAVAIVNIADTFMLGVLWVTLQDVSRHSSQHPYVIFGFAWAARVLSRNLGRILIGVIGAVASAATVVVGIIGLALAVSMALLLSDDIFRRRPLFAGSAVTDRAAISGDVSVAGVDGQEAAAAGAGVAADFVSAPAAIDVGGGDVATAPRADAELRFQETYGLSDREMEIIRYTMQGRSKAFIAGQIYLSENTVRAHAKRIYTKLGIHSKQALIDRFLDFT